jgi:type VI secretion system protein ImpL
VTGAKPITGDTVERIFYIILNEPLDLTPLTSMSAPPAVCDLVARCTAKNPADRPQGLEPVCALLEELLAGPGEPATVAAQSGGAAAAMAPAPATPAPTPQPVRAAGPRPRRRLVLWAAGAALVLLLGCGLGLAWFGYRPLDANLRSSADAISAAGIAADGLVSPEALGQFENLRGSLDTVHRYHRKGAPLGYGLGVMLWGDLYPSGRRLYFERFRTFLLGPAHNNVLQFLRGLPATPGPAYGPVYEALKAYLMTTSQPAKSDAQFLAPVLLLWWGSGMNVDADREAAARRQFEFYAQELRQDNPFTTDHDAEAVATARRYLSQFASVERVYAFLLEDAAKHNPPLSFNRQFAGSEQVLAADYEVPGAFTKGGWDFVKDAISHSERYFGGESWVAGGNAAAGMDHARLAEELNARYRADFAKAWRQYLRSGSVVRFASLKEAVQKLDQLCGEKSPLSEWLSVAAVNTDVDVPAVAAIFQPVRAATAASQSYRDALSALRASLQKAAGQGSAPSDAAVAETTAAAQQTLKTVKQIGASFHSDAEGQLETQVVRMLEEPVTAARSVLRAGGLAEWNVRGSDLCAQMEPVLKKYPFTAGASAQASAQEIASLFRPQVGVLWKLYDTSLHKLILRHGPRYIASASTGLPVNPAFLAFLNRAAVFSDGAFTGGGALPKFRYSLRPVLTPEIDSIKLTIDGQSATFKGKAASKAFVWPGSGAQELRLNVKFKSKNAYNWTKTATPWSVLLFFDGATRRQGTQIEIPLREQTPSAGSQPASLWFEVTATPPVFDRGYFPGLACVPQIVKQWGPQLYVFAWGRGGLCSAQLWRASERYCEGDTPSTRLKVRWKWLGSLKPAWAAISPSGVSDEDNSRQANSMRRRRR